jgi:hypothetical protein
MAMAGMRQYIKLTHYPLLPMWVVPHGLCKAGLPLALSLNTQTLDLGLQPSDFKL